MLTQTVSGYAERLRRNHIAATFTCAMTGAWQGLPWALGSSFSFRLLARAFHAVVWRGRFLGGGLLDGGARGWLAGAVVGVSVGPWVVVGGFVAFSRMTSPCNDGGRRSSWSTCRNAWASSSSAPTYARHANQACCSSPARQSRAYRTGRLRRHRRRRHPLRKAHHHCHLARADSHKPCPNQTPDGHGGE